jgi:hypothetical protein
METDRGIATLAQICMCIHILLTKKQREQKQTNHEFFNVIKITEKNKY